VNNSGQNLIWLEQCFRKEKKRKKGRKEGKTEKGNRAPQSDATQSLVPLQKSLLVLLSISYSFFQGRGEKKKEEKEKKEEEKERERGKKEGGAGSRNPRQWQKAGIY